ncbi:chemotaxis protein CheW [Halobaculum rubrum]|uniref:chemotaxis protein CheW n=1 Tax=Halobaculum rubrum TaxID=2872158 RepID=UPI001CA3FBA6|nr:chemotaxis protein CheW [Halobaculum rubrum]QZY00716.1 chemotaxis protein CheW [Halobaculum rubrum]
MASSQRTADDDAVSAEETTQVLEFGLGDETYCLDIAYIDEIVDAGDLTAIPNSPRHVEGVMDLRGKTTTIIDPKTLLGVTGTGARERIIVFDPEEVDDGGTVGWVVDEVFQVRDVTADQVDEATTAGDDSVRGIVKGDDRFVVWVEPHTE